MAETKKKIPKCKFHKPDGKKTIRVIRAALTAAFVFFCLSGTWGQDQRVADSIAILLSEATSDSLRLELLRVTAINSSSPDDKIRYAEMLEELASDRNSIAYLQSAMNSLGTAYRLKGNLDKALFYLLESARIAEENSLLKSLGETYSEIASLYSANDDLTNALEFNTKAISIFKETGDTIPQSLTLMNKGYQFYELGQLDSALAYYARSEVLFNAIDLKIGKAYVVGNRALVHLAQGKVDTAELSINMAIALLEPMGDKYGIADFLNQLGKVYIEIGENEKAISSIQRGITIAKQIDLKEQIRDASQLLSNLYREKGDYLAALDYQSEYIGYKDSIQNMETVRQLANQRTEFEVGLKQAEVDLLEARQENQRIAFIALSIFLLLVLVAGAIVYKYYVTKNRLSKALALQKNQLEELNQTKDKFFSIISHDLRSPVSAFLGISRMIKMLVKTEKTDELIELTKDIDQSVDRLSSLLDNLLNWAMQQQGHFPNTPEPVDLDKLAEDLLATFSNMAKGKGIQLSSEIPANTALWVDRNSMATVLRNLINNAIKFTSQGGHVRVEAVIAGAGCRISVSDDGVGIPEEKREQLFNMSGKRSAYGTHGEKGLGLGLQLVQEFVQMNNGSIDVQSEPGKGTTFTIEMPLYQEQTADAQPAV